MSISRKTLAALLAAAGIIFMTACDESALVSGGSSSNSPQTTSAATTTTNTLDDDVNNPVDITGLAAEGTLSDPNLTYFGYYDMRVAGDIKPGVKLFEETYGGNIDYISCAWDERISKLQVMISSGDSPDLVDRETITFPHLMSKNVYEDLTGYIDISQPQWDGYEDLIERYTWNGCHYYYPFTVNALPDCLIYDAGRFRSLGLDDPRDLYDSGNWTWETFEQMMIDFMKADTDAIGGVYGLVSNDIILTTGTPLITIENGQIINNVGSADVERAANYLMGLRRQGLAVRGDGMWSNEPAPLVKGKVAFLGVGQWKITDFCKNYPEQDFQFVPYPRDPSAVAYYYNTSAFGYMVPKGSDNVEGAAAFIDIMRKCQTDPELKAVVKTSIMNDKQYSDEQYEFLTSFEDIGKFDLVVDTYSGFNEDLTSLIDTMLTNLAFEQGEDQKSWAQLKPENEGIIQGVLDTYTQQ